MSSARAEPCFRVWQTEPFDADVLFGSAALIIRGGERGLTVVNLRAPTGCTTVRLSPWLNDGPFVCWVDHVFTHFEIAMEFAKRLPP